MKKVLKSLILLVIAFILIAPLTAQADMGAPTFHSFEMQVVTPDGVDYYKSYQNMDTKEGTLAKDTVVTILSETTDSNNNTFYSFRAGTTNRINGYLKSLNGLVLLQDSLTLADLPRNEGFEKEEVAQKALVYKESGVDLLKGPASAYAKIATIEKGTVLEYQHYLGGDGINSRSYIYVETDKGNGWVKLLDGEVLIENDTEYIFKTDKAISSEVTIPANTILKPEYKTDGWTGKALFKYNGSETLLNVFKDNVALPVWDAKYTAKTELNIYKTYDPNGEIIGKLPAGTEFNYKSAYDEEEYGSGDSNSNIYIEYNGIKGWIYTNYKNLKAVDGTVSPSTNPTNAVSENTTVVNITGNEVNTNRIVTPPSAKDENMPIETTILICALAGISIALAAVVIILLVNKKTKNNIQANPNINMNQAVNPNMNPNMYPNMNQNINPVQSNDINQNNNPGQNG